MTSASKTQPADDVLTGFDESRSNLIPILQTVQARYAYLPKDVLETVSRKLRVPLPEVYRVATFYSCFTLVPRGRHLVQVCQGTACHVRGGQRLLERAMTDAGVDSTGTSPDLEFTVEPVRCLGCCALAPVVRVDQDTYAHLELGRVKRVLSRYRGKPAGGGNGDGHDGPHDHDDGEEGES